MVGVIHVIAAVPLRSRENFVLNRWRIADAVNDLSMLVACGLFEWIAAALRLDKRVSVKFGKVCRNDGVFGEHPLETNRALLMWIETAPWGNKALFGAQLNNGYTQKPKRRLWAVRSAVTGFRGGPLGESPPLETL